MRRGAAMLAAWAILSAGVAMARDPDPVLHIPLTAMGFQTMLPEFLNSGSSMVTVDFVDAGHLLVTFGVRKLMKRVTDGPPGDDDRTIGAFLVELPSGKVLARTEWRTHDRGQYLWNLGYGRFLLRIRDRLTMFAPMVAATPGDAFQELPFLQVDRHILAIVLSADDDLLTIETADRAEMESGRPRFAADDPPPNPAPVQINFYRLKSTGPEAGKLVIASAGVLRARAALALPLTAAGFLDVLEGGRDRWMFNFDTHAGKVSELAQFDTTCFPRTMFVSHSEFVAFGCRGTTDKQDIAGFNLKGDAMWQQNFFDTQSAPSFAFAPAAGRFALQRTIVGTLDPMASVTPGVVSSQEVRVYQTYNGKQLLRADCTPAVRAGQNFALSPDGLQLAVLREAMVAHKATVDDDAYTAREATVDIYALPALTGKDQAAVKEAQGFAPEDTGVRVDVAMQRVFAKAGANAATNAAADAAASAAADLPGTGPGPGEATAAAAEEVSGDAEPTAPRQPPTLYGPGETPQGKSPK
jgi:hypothetical protein